jgi:hypothetical protein
MLKKILWLVLLSSTLLFATDNNNTKLEDAIKQMPFIKKLQPLMKLSKIIYGSSVMEII